MNSTDNPTINYYGTRYTINLTLNDDLGANSGIIRTYEYDEGTNTWSQIGQDIKGDGLIGNDGFRATRLNRSSDSSIDGKYLILGSPWANTEDRYGHVEYWEYNGSNAWNQIGGDLESPSKAADNYFGSAVSISNDGNRIAIAESRGDTNGQDTSSLYIYEKSGTNFNLVGNVIGFVPETNSPYFGNADNTMQLSGNGERVAIQSTNSDLYGSNYGQILVYEYDGSNTWNQIGQTIYHTIEMGTGCFLNNDGSILAAEIYGGG
jgi:hypothetical protein